MFILQNHPPFCTSLFQFIHLSVPFNTYAMCNYHFPFLILTIPLISLYHAFSIDVVGDAIAGQVPGRSIFMYVCMSVERTVVAISSCALLILIGNDCYIFNNINNFPFACACAVHEMELAFA